MEVTDSSFTPAVCFVFCYMSFHTNPALLSAEHSCLDRTASASLLNTLIMLQPGSVN